MPLEVVTGEPVDLVAVAMINQKGGVGKTTTSIHLASGLAGRGFRVLLVDVDPQGTATRATIEGTTQGTAEVLGFGVGGSTDMAELLPLVVRRSESYAVDVIGANIENLTHQEVALTTRYDFVTRFLDLLDAAEGKYDFIVFDCPPALRSLTTATMCAATHIVLVMEPSIESIDGMAHLVSYLKGLRGLVKRELAVSGAVITKADPREVIYKMVEEELARFPWVQPIYNTVGFREAYSVGRPLPAIAHSPAHLRAAEDLRALVDRVAAFRSEMAV